MPSNSSMSYFPNNSLSQYTIRLESSIELKEESEIGLSEIIFTKSWKNVRDSWIRIDYGDQVHTGMLQVKQGFYSSIEEIVLTLNGMVSSSYALDKCVEFIFSKEANEVEIKLKMNESLKLTLSKELCGILGHAKRMNATDETLELSASPSMDIYYLPLSIADINNGFYNIYVYCDLCDLVPVGDVQAPLLRIVPLGTEAHYTNQWTVYNNVQYVPMRKKKFNTITVYLMTDTGQPVHFETGKSVVTVEIQHKST